MMKSMARAKSLSDLRTILSTHARSTPRLKGTAYLEAFLLEKEGQRLEAELARLTHRQRRVEERLREIRETTHKLARRAQEEESPVLPPIGDGNLLPEAGSSAPRTWKKMTIEY